MCYECMFLNFIILNIHIVFSFQVPFYFDEKQRLAVIAAGQYYINFSLNIFRENCFVKNSSNK